MESLVGRWIGMRVFVGVWFVWLVGFVFEYGYLRVVE